MNTPDLLSAAESCGLRGHWSREWESNRMTGVQMLQGAIRTAMLSEEPTVGELAGSEVMEYGHSRGLDDATHDPYSAVCSLACLADILSVAIRGKEAAWGVPETLVRESYVWNSGALLSPRSTHLRRVVLASSWSPERQASEINSWRSIGEIVQFGKPMEMVVAILGPHRDGKRHSHFTKGMIHPRSGKLRFRKKSNTSTTEFKDTWIKTWRENRADISAHQWLEAMAQDDVLSESLFVIEIPVPDESKIGQIREMAAKKLEAIWSRTEVPEQNLSTCYWPNPCSFLGICKADKWKEPSRKAGFVEVNSLFQIAMPQPPLLSLES